MTWLGRWLSNQPYLCWLLIALLSVPPALGLWGVRLFPEHKQRWTTPAERDMIKRLRQEFSANFADVPIVAVLQCDDFFTPDRLAALERVVKRLRGIRAVRSLMWCGDVPARLDMMQALIAPSFRPLLPPAAESTAAELQQVGQQVREHPLTAGHFISADGKTMLLLIACFNRERFSRIEKAASELSEFGIRFRLTGRSALLHAHHEIFGADHLRIFVTACILVIGLALLIFRGIAAILVACSGPGFAVFWAVGVVALLGQAGNRMSQVILPVMTLMIAFTDSVHLVLHLRSELAAGADIRTARARSIAQVGMACLLTSLTTAIGFGSLMFSDAEVVAGFGRNCAAGVTLAFVAVVLVTPVASGGIMVAGLRASQQRDFLAPQMRQLAPWVDWLVRHARLVSLTGVLITTGLIICGSRLQPDDRFAHRVPRNSDAYLAMLHLEDTFGGVSFLRLTMAWPEQASRQQIWTVLKKIEATVDDEPTLGRPLSVRNLLGVFGDIEGDQAYRLLNFLTRVPEEQRQAIWRSDTRRTQILARNKDLGIAHYRPVVDHLEQKLKQIEQEHPGFVISVTGDQLLENEIIQGVVEDLIASLMTAAVVIFVVITIAFRSLRLGLVSLLPNLFPLAATAALRSFVDHSLDIASACSFAICLGIAVDDTIHFLTRFQWERRHGASTKEAIHRAFVGVGSALVMTTTVLAAGFSTVMTSQLPTHYLFAGMALTTILAALIGDLILLPALLGTVGDHNSTSTTESETGRPK